MKAAKIRRMGTAVILEPTTRAVSQLAFPPTSGMPPLLDLPTELLIQIFSNLHISEFGPCLLTCHRLKGIIQESRLLQYLIRTALAGVYDPLLPSTSSLPTRLESLERWSAAWQQPGVHLRSPSRVLLLRDKLNADFLLHDDYLVAVDLGRGHRYRHAVGYEWLDLRRPGNDWINLRFEQGLVPLTFAFDVVQQHLFAGFFG
jgi:F-box-like